MKTINIFLILLVLIAGFTACDDQLDVANNNEETSDNFPSSEEDLQDAVVACYNRIRLEGTFSRVGYTLDAVRGDEVWNASQVWYLPYDNFNAASDNTIGNEWIYRDCFHVVNRCNLVIQGVDDVELDEETYNEIKGQALFLRGLAYYELATYQQTVPLITDYSSYATMTSLYASSAPQDSIFDQIEEDFSNAMTMLPSRDDGGEWAEGRATCGSAAGYLARAYMFRHKYDEALTVLNDIIAGTYGTYELMADFGDNFREGTAYENNAESLFEVQFMDFGTGGSTAEWTPGNISTDATQGHAVESNYGPADFGSWADLAGSPWLYNLFKAEKCTDGRLDPRLYWTLDSYESEYDSYTGVSTDAYPDGDPRSNTIYETAISSSAISNTTNGGIAIAKWTYARDEICSTITVGLNCGINLRLMRYSDVLLRAAECINEISGPTQKAIDYINKVRERVALEDLQLSDFAGDADKLFEQIANVERPKEFGCENGRGIDLIRWGFFYSDDRLAQMDQHSCYMLDGTANGDELTTETADDYSFKYYTDGHEYFPICTSIIDANSSVSKNSANTGTSNADDWKASYGGDPRPVVDLDE